MQGQAGFFDIDERLKEISAKGDDLERLNAIVALLDPHHGSDPPDWLGELLRSALRDVVATGR